MSYMQLGHRPGLLLIARHGLSALSPSGTSSSPSIFAAVSSRSGFFTGILASATTRQGQHRTMVSLPDGNDVGKIVSSATEKLGLGDNQFAAGGFQLALIGAVLAGARVLGSHAFEYFKKQIVVSAELDSRDECFSWILNWLSDHPYAKRATNFSVSTTIARGAQKINGEGGDGAIATTYFLPAPGLHFFWFKNRLLWMYRERVRPAGSTVATSGAAVENITISTLGRSRHLIETLIHEAQLKFIERDKSRTVIFAADQYGAWRRTKSRPKRPLDTIVMDPALKNYIVDDAKEFFESEAWYADRGLPFRRGLLLYGTPGTGKTSFIHALAGELGLNIYVINLSNKSLTDDTLSELVSDTPARCLLLLEDVDASFTQRESKDASANITFSGLLNAIDGVAAQEGRMLCMTTNHLDRLDDALIRPGRVDIRARFGKATRDQAKELFVKFFPQRPYPSVAASTTSTIESPESTKARATGTFWEREQTEKLAEKFASAIPDQAFSIAQLQGFLMGYKKNPELAADLVQEFVNQPLKLSRAASPSHFVGSDVNDENDDDAANQVLECAALRERKEFQLEKEHERQSSLTEQAKSP